MSWTVVKPFFDSYDNFHEYKEGDEFPRKGLTVSPLRIKELSGKKNRQGVPLIAEVKKKGK